MIRAITYPIIIGYVLSKVYEAAVGEPFHTDHITSLFGSGSTIVTATGGKLDVSAGTWKFRSEKNGLATYSKAVAGTPLMALKGTGILNMHVSVAVGTFLDSCRCYDWVDMLDVMTEVPYDKSTIIAPEDVENASYKAVDFSDRSMNAKKASSYRARKENCWNRADSIMKKKKFIHKDNFTFKDLVHQQLKLPWPISPRELLLQRNWEFDDKKKRVYMHYNSIEDTRVPHKEGFIRAESPHMVWIFEKRPPKIITNKAGLTEEVDQTYVQVECFVDSKGSIPAWFINYLQSNWPTKVLREFQKLVDKAEGYEPWPGLVHW